MLSRPCLGMPKRVYLLTPPCKVIQMCLCPDCFGGGPCPVSPWSQPGRYAPCKHMAPPKCVPCKCIALPVIPVLNLPLLQGLKCMQGRTALLWSGAEQSRAEQDEVGGCAAQGCTGSTRRNTEVCLFCLSTVPTMTYRWGGAAQRKIASVFN